MLKLFCALFSAISFVSYLNVNAERTFTLIKSHAVESKDAPAIIEMIEDGGFKIKKKKRLIMTEKKFESLYGVHRDRSFFNDLRASLVGRKVIAIIIEGDNVVREYRHFIGNTDPELAKEGTIRRKFGIDKTRNAVHASDSKENAEREISIFFPLS